MEIVFTGGGTGGHIFPILAIVREMKRIYPREDLGIFYIGPRDKYALSTLEQENIKIKRIFAGKIRRYFSLQNILDIFIKIPLGFCQAFFFLFFIAPDVVVSKGGYGSFPVALAARILHIPLFIHESDVVPGLTVKKTSNWASEIFVSFPSTDFFPKEKILTVGNAIRREILSGTKDKAREIFGLQQDKPLIFIVGGSQGAQRINEIILQILPEMLKEFELIHVAGQNNFQQIKAEANVVTPKELKGYYHIYPFLEEEKYKHALKAADFVVARAGSGTIFEIAAAGKPSLLIPLPHSAQNHQTRNAYAYSKTGASQVLEENNLRAHFFLERLKYLFSRPTDLKIMADKTKQFARPKAARIIAAYILEYLSPHKEGSD